MLLKISNRRALSEEGTVDEKTIKLVKDVKTICTKVETNFTAHEANVKEIKEQQESIKDLLDTIHSKIDSIILRG